MTNQDKISISEKKQIEQSITYARVCNICHKTELKFARWVEWTQHRGGAMTIQFNIEEGPYICHECQLKKKV